MGTVARRQPSDNLEELQGQLLRELAKLQDCSGNEPELFRAYVQHILVLAWRGVADGRMRAPREALDCLRVAQPFIDHFMPGFVAPAAAAAAEIYFLTQSLSLATAALEERRVEDRISDPRSKTERAILQVLAENRGTFLRRGEVHENLNQADRPTSPRVGQLLVELHGENLVLRIHGRAQGNPNAAFYALSPRGVELCRSLGLIERETDLPSPILEAIAVVCDLRSNWERRRVALGVLATEGIGPRKTLILKALIAKTESSQDARLEKLVDEAIQQVVTASRAPRVQTTEGAHVLFSQKPKEKPQLVKRAFAHA